MKATLSLAFSSKNALSLSDNWLYQSQTLHFFFGDGFAASYISAKDIAAPSGYGLYQ
jgi:hypothetical protein